MSGSYSLVPIVWFLLTGSDCLVPTVRSSLHSSYPLYEVPALCPHSPGQEDEEGWQEEPVSSHFLLFPPTGEYFSHCQIQPIQMKIHILNSLTLEKDYPGWWQDQLVASILLLTGPSDHSARMEVRQLQLSCCSQAVTLLTLLTLVTFVPEASVVYCAGNVVYCKVKCCLVWSVVCSLVLYSVLQYC